MQAFGCSALSLIMLLFFGIFGISSVETSLDSTNGTPAPIESPDQLNWDPAMNDLSLGDYAAPHAEIDPVIDGVGDDAAWDKAEWRALTYRWLGDTPLENSDFMGRYKIVWAADRLYYLVEIYDDVLADIRTDPLQEYWLDDALEVFVDEDHSGGNHQYNHSAFAYHISLSYDVVDSGINGQPTLFNDHINVRRTDNGHLSTWEFGVLIYDSSYRQFSDDNQPVELEAGKEMGFALAYCDSDTTGMREHFIGSIGGPNVQDAWIDAGLFGTLTLLPD